jgi:hypothetical protein
LPSADHFEPGERPGTPFGVIFVGVFRDQCAVPDPPQHQSEWNKVIYLLIVVLLTMIIQFVSLEKRMKSRVHGTVRAALLASAFVGMCVQAQEVYVGAGLFGAQVGYAHALTPTVNLRADYMTLGNRSSTSNKSGTDYQSKLDWSRTALLVDWFPSASSSFRLTGGATFNKITYDMTAAAAGQTVDINGTSYTLGANDSMNIQIKMPRTTPYVGVGWGHQSSQKGWGFHADLGVSVGQFKVTETRTGALVNVNQTDVDKELADVRDSVSRLRVLPQVTIGASYRF